TSVSTTSSHVSSSTAARESRARIEAAEWSRRASARTARSRARRRSSAGTALRLDRLLDRALGELARGRRCRGLPLRGGFLVGRLGDRQQPGGRDLVIAELGLDPLEDRLRHVRVLTQEGGRILAPLAEPLVLEAEVRPRLLDDLSLERRVEHGSLPGDAESVEDVELGLLERRSDLVLRHLDPHAVSDRLDAFLEGL